ncbi:unnamed protein product [Miscanthus lutarioriparius]|uniref:Uncharacterized protein n=1 Tax=Miscanthus lutarioriparius TaxID=422564 RepID=A0A811PA95_9POAL|nr:unnamed protein product [Miscanthus lutarioriparius]
MDGISNGGENNAAALPLGGGESQFMLDLRRNLPSKLYRVGFATSATAVGGLVEQLVAAASSRSRRQAEADVPLSQLPLFLLLVILFGALGTIYTGRRLEVELAPTPRWRKAGVAIYFLCFLLAIAAASLVGPDICVLALNFLDN